MRQKLLTSWLGINSIVPSEIYVPGSIGELQHRLRQLKHEQRSYQVVGSNHSYNGVQLVDGQVAIVTAGSGLTEIAYDSVSHEVTVEAGVTVAQLKRYLRRIDRQLVTSGNHMQQTVIGAFLTGTHGYGIDTALMADSVVRMTVLDEDGREHEIVDPQELALFRVSFGYLGIVVRATLRTVGLRQFRVRQRLLRLSELGPQLQGLGKTAHGLSLFPYSSAEDPIVGLVTFERLRTECEPTAVRRSVRLVRELSWLLIKLVWSLDRRVPGFKPLLQRLVRLFETRNVDDIITDPRDLDSFYDYLPLREQERNPDIIRQLFDPKYTANNIALIVSDTEFVPFFHEIFALAQRYRRRPHRKFLKDVVGVRYIGASQQSAMAGNYRRRSYSVDLFFAPNDKAFAAEIQRLLSRQFATRPHFGKTLLDRDTVESIPEDLRRQFLALRSRYQRSSLLQPDVTVR